MSGTDRKDEGNKAGRPGRAERLAERLRDNLRRRKLQARERREAPPEERDGG